MSGEVMGFPKSVEEFMEEYKVVDTEHVYTNGTELVPIFRMEQWFEHLRHGKWKYVEAYKGAKFGFYKCSVCGEPWWNTMKYCGNCGAKMDEEVVK